MARLVLGNVPVEHTVYIVEACMCDDEHISYSVSPLFILGRVFQMKYWRRFS